MARNEGEDILARARALRGKPKKAAEPTGGAPAQAAPPPHVARPAPTVPQAPATPGNPLATAARGVVVASAGGASAAPGPRRLP